MLNQLVERQVVQCIRKTKRNSMCIIKLGNVVDGLINVITGGWGKDIASFFAKKFFDRDDCGCEARRIYLNELCGCKEQIKLW
jgi:hypothetical protein